jgi:aspartate aminotransferase
MGIIADRLNVIKPSATVALNSKAMEMKAAGEDVIGLAAGEPDFDTPETARVAGIAAIQSGDTKYTAPDGRPELKAAVARKFERENNVKYDPKLSLHLWRLMYRPLLRVMRLIWWPIILRC